jgi:WD40 repeat protein
MFDAYHKWLGIPKGQGSPTHYQLLGIVADEMDAEVIEEAAIRQSTHLRSYQIGPHAGACTRLLNEISEARNVLLDPAKREAYDRQLNPPRPAVKRARQVGPRQQTIAGPVSSALLIGLAGGVALGVVLLVGAVTAYLVLRDAGPQPSGKSTEVAKSTGDTRPASTTKPSDTVKATPKQGDPKVNVDTKDRVDPNDGFELPLKPGLNVGKRRTLRTESLRCIVVLPDNRQLLIAGTNKICLRDIKDGKESFRFPNQENNPVPFIGVDKQGKHAVISGMTFNSAEFWDLERREKVGKVTHPEDGVRSVAISPDGKFVLTSGYGVLDKTNKFINAYVRVWDFQTQTELWRFNEGHEYAPHLIDFVPGGPKALTLSGDQFYVWDLDRRLQVGKFFGGDASSAGWALSPDGRYLVTCNRRLCRLIDLNAGNKEVARWIVPGDTDADRVAFSPDGKYLASGGRDSLVRILVARTLTVLETLPAPIKSIYGLAFAPNGRFLVAGGPEADSYMWSLVYSDPGKAKALGPTSGKP